MVLVARRREDVGQTDGKWAALRHQGGMMALSERNEIPAEADRVLRIWGDYKRNEGGVVALGYPRHSAGFASGGDSTEDSFQELVDKADRRTGTIADAILDEMSRDGSHARHVLAIWNRYMGDVARFRGDHEAILVEGCRVFLIKARRRGIAV